MFESEESQRRIGRFAWVMAWVGLVVGQLHALARHATEDGREDLELPLTAAWSVPATEWFSPLLTWADPDLVYVTYGKIWFPVFVAFTLCAYVVHRRRRPQGFEKVAWRATLGAYALACVGALLSYWTQWTGNYHGDGMEGTLFSVAWVITIPGLLLTLLCSTVLGVALLVRRFRPVLPAVLLAAVVPLAFGIGQFTSMGSLALPLMFGFGILGRRIARSTELTEPAAGVSSRTAA